MSDRAKILKTLGEIAESYYKWKAVGVVGIWLGSGVACIGKDPNTALVILLIATFASLIYCLVGVPEMPGED